MSSPSKPDAHLPRSKAAPNKAADQEHNLPGANQQDRETGEKLFRFADLKQAEEALLRERRRVAFGASTASSSGEPQEQSHQGRACNASPVAEQGPATCEDRDSKGVTDKSDCEESSEFTDVVGLALSGGGLRSALFNDGFLRALSHCGLLRYVDYLCSVSGGGYIAGHLLTKAEGGDKDKQPQNFHATKPEANPDNPDCDEPPKPAWWLGVNPDNGKVDAEHLPNVGSYLQSTWKGMVSFVRYQVATKCVYIGLLGTIATLLALGFRSFDEPVYRMVVEDDIGFFDGGEIVFSFLPTLAVAILLVISVGFDSLLRASNRLFRNNDDAMSVLKKIGTVSHRIVGLLLFLSLFFLVTSVAVSIGNSLTTARTGTNNELHLNYFANYIALIAGAIQILVFLGRDRLFKSEKSEAANWQKALQSVVTFAVVGVAFFAFVHLMACENVSQFANHRDPFLLRGEVTDWKRLHHIAQQATTLNGKERDREERVAEFNRRFPVEALDRELYSRQMSPSNSRKYLASNILNGQAQSLYGDAAQEESEPAVPKEFQAPEYELSGFGRMSRLAAYSFLPAKFADVLADNQSARARQMLEKQSKFVDHFNKNFLVEPSFTDYLIDRLKIKFVGQENATPQWDATASVESEGEGASVSFNASQSVPPASPKLLVDSEWLASHLHGWSTSNRERFCSLMQAHALHFTKSSPDHENASKTTDSSRLPNSAADGIAAAPESLQKLQTAELNHFLLELIGGKLLVAHNDVSTHYIQPHDQQARLRWLVVWLSLLTFGLMATIDLNAIVYAYYFYRSRIATHFLRKQPDGRFCGETMLEDLKPTEHGLPFPIYQATWQRPNQAADSFQIESENVTCTPLGVHLWNRNVAGTTSHDGEIVKEQSAVAVSNDPIKLKDAVAISGSAVTPLMTNNIALAAILDFFGGRIGRWLKFQHPDSEQGGQTTHDKGPVILVLVAVCIICLTFTGLSLILKSLIIATCVLLAIGHCFNLGYPYLLANMFLPKGTSAASLGDQLTEASKRWPRAFVADGGFYDFLGVNELIRRRCKLIIVSDAGVNAGEHTLSSLAKMCHNATSQQGVRFLDLDHDAPIDFGRLNRDDRRLVAQPFLAMRIKYPEIEECGYLFYAQMAITESDPIEIQQIRHCFPSFPDEPTTNQFYTDEQVEAYQHLGYHIGNRLCNNIHRWNEAEIWTQSKHYPSEYSGAMQPLLSEVEKRLKRAYVQACYEEISYREDDVYGESIWTGNSAESRFPSFAGETVALHNIDAVLSSWELQGHPANEAQDHRHEREKTRKRLRAKCNYWLQKSMTNADIAAAYLETVCSVVNRDVYGTLDYRATTTSSLVAAIVDGKLELNNEIDFKLGQDFSEATKHCYAAHLAALAISCQQLHRGSPSAIFQIGGRSKLVSIVVKLALDIADLFKKHDKYPFVDGLPQIANEVSMRIVNEVIELKSSVFLDADDQAAVSFAQCICHELSELALEVPSSIDWSHAKSCNSYADFRQLLQESLKSGYISQSQGILSEYIEALGGGSPACRPGTELIKQIPTRSR